MSEQPGDAPRVWIDSHGVVHDESGAQRPIKPGTWYRVTITSDGTTVRTEREEWDAAEGGTR